METTLPIGFAFEELTEEEMMEIDGGAWFTVLSTTTLACIGASVVISAGASLLITATLCK